MRGAVGQCIERLVKGRALARPSEQSERFEFVRETLKKPLFIEIVSL